MLRKILKILLIIAGSLAGLIVLLVILVWLGLLNGIVADIIVKQANKNLNGELTIGSLSGNLLSGFSLSDVSVVDESDTVIHSGEIAIDYSLGPLLKKEVRIDLINIKDVHVNLLQEKDSAWNIMKLLKETEEQADTASGDFSWKIFIGDVRAERLSAGISSLDTTGMIPVYAETGFHLQASVSGENVSATLDSMRIVTREPDFEVVSLTGRLQKEGSVLTWNDAELRLENSILLTHGTFSLSENNDIEAELELVPFDFDDLRSVIPELQVYGSPDIKASVKGNSSEYRLEGVIREENQGITLSGSLSNPSDDPEYNVRIIVENLDGSHWTHNEKMKTDISGNIAFSGRGFDPKENELTVDAVFSEIKYDTYLVDHLVLNAEKVKDRLSGNLRATTFAGNAAVDYLLSDVFGNPAYDLTSTYNNVNIENLPGIDSITSDLNGELKIKGRGISPETATAVLELNSGNSSISGESLGDFSLDADYDKGQYTFGLTGFGAPYFFIDARGTGNLKSGHDISFSLEPVDPGRLAAVFGLPDIGVAGKITGNVSGTMDSLQANIVIALDSLRYDTIRIEQVSSEAVISLIEKEVAANLNLSTGLIRSGDLSILSADVNGDYAGDNISAEISVSVTDSLHATFTGSVEGFENPMIRIMNLGITYGGAEWSTPHDTASVVLKESDVTVNSFTLSSGDQQINVNGRFAFEGEEDISLQVINLDLQSLPLQEFIPYEISGLLNSAFALTGTAGSPMIAGSIDAERIDVNGFLIDSIVVDMGYQDNLFKLSGNILTGLYESIRVMLDVPVIISFTDSIVVLSDSPQLEGSIKVDSLDLEKMAGFFPVKDMSAEGFADVNVEVTNTLNDPVIAGTFSLSNGRFRNDRFGIRYDDIRLFASIDSSTVGLDTLSLRTRKGNLALNGFVSLENTDSVPLNDFSLKLRARDFQAMESGSLELNFDSDLDLSGTLGNPGFKGNLGINRSRINIDYFNEVLSQKTDEPNPPLLIQALKDTIEVDIQADTASKGPIFPGADFMKNLQGEATIDIPGNTWVTGKDMNFELNGSVRAVKASENISLFGDLNVRRGYYKIYGRNFDFERGKITFTGSSEFNPDVDFEIVYRFRDMEKELRNLKLLITGKMLQPDLRFMLDDEAVEEKDAISYIAFGKSVNQLGEGERDKISGQDIAMGAAVTQLSSVLKGVLQESAGVDVFEVTGGEDWKSGNVTIGKYITNNLFLSYDRSFDFNKQSKTANTERIMLEYQIIRNLILKATNQEINSGFDLIWRKNWK